MQIYHPLILQASTLQLKPLYRESGIPFTLLRNGWYTENYTGSKPGTLGGGAFLGSAGDVKISSAAHKDFAEAAVVVLTSEGHKGKVYELAGGNSYTLTDFAAEISRHSGKDFPYKNLPEAEYHTKDFYTSLSFEIKLIPIFICMNHLHFGDCLNVLCDLKENFRSFLLTSFILTLPFNSKRNYNVLFESMDMMDANDQKQAFADTWTNVTCRKNNEN